jgi:hypothetical protein
MPRRPCTFKQQDVTRALRAAKAAGQSVRRFEIARDGTLRVFVGEPDARRDEYSNPWDGVLSDAQDTNRSS